MIARYRRCGSKKITCGRDTIEISSEWTEINDIKIFKKIKRSPDIFETATFFDLKPFESIAEYIIFEKNLIKTSHNAAITKLQKIPFVVLQAIVKGTNKHVFRIATYNNQRLDIHKKNKSKDINVLIFRKLGGIGDVTMTLPVLEKARKSYPDYKITYSCLSEFLPVVMNNPNADYIEPLSKELTKRNWDIVIDLTKDCINYEVQNQPDVKMNRAEIFMDKCGLSYKDIPWPKIYLSEDEIIDAKNELKGLGLKIGFVLESNAPVRNWSKFEQLRNKTLELYPDAAILEFCHKQPDDWKNHNNIYPVFDRPLREVIALINECDIIVSPDTGLAHISSALRIPTIWLFTHIDGKIRTKNYDQDIIYVIQNTPEECIKPCWYKIPCSREQNVNLLEKKKNPKCSENILVDYVLGEIQSALSRPGLSYCVVYHNRSDIVMECLRRVERYKKFNEQVVLIANGAQDKSPIAFVKNKIGMNETIVFDNNEGCIKARNAAIKSAVGNFILTLDDDQYLSADSVHKLKNIQADIVGVEAWSMTDDGYAFDIKDGKGELAYVGAGGMLAKKSVLDDVGYFDEIYSPAWFEDPDLCFRAKEKGYTINYAENHGIQHLAHQTSNTQKTFDMRAVWERSHKIFSERFLKNKKINVIIKKKLKIHAIADVHGWAWDNKLREIIKHIGSDFDFYISYAVEGIRNVEHDFWFFFECNPHYMPGQAYQSKYITGATAHQYVNFKDYKKLLGDAIGIHANSILLFEELKYLNKNCFYCPNGVNQHKFKFVERNINEEFTAAYVGKNIPRKGLEEFIIPACEKANIKLKLQSCKYKSENKIDHNDMPEFYRDIDCVIVASDMDGTPNQLLEGASVGRTFVGNRIGNIPEFVQQGVNGFMINRNVDDYVEKLLWLKNHRKECQRMGEQARLAVEQEWGWNIQSQRYKKMFEEIGKML